MRSVAVAVSMLSVMLVKALTMAEKPISRRMSAREVSRVERREKTNRHDNTHTIPRSPSRVRAGPPCDRH